MTSKLVLQLLCHRSSNLFFFHIWKTFPLVEVYLGFKVKLREYSATAFKHCLLLHPAPGNPPEPCFSFSIPLFALHCLITNPCLSFHLVTFVQAKLPMEGPQSADPFVLQAFQFLTFTAPAPFTCFVFGNDGLLFACHKRFQESHSH